MEKTGIAESLKIIGDFDKLIKYEDASQYFDRLEVTEITKAIACRNILISYYQSINENYEAKRQCKLQYHALNFQRESSIKTKDNGGEYYFTLELANNYLKIVEISFTIVERAPDANFLNLLEEFKFLYERLKLSYRILKHTLNLKSEDELRTEKKVWLSFLELYLFIAKYYRLKIKYKIHFNKSRDLNESLKYSMFAIDVLDQISTRKSSRQRFMEICHDLGKLILHSKRLVPYNSFDKIYRYVKLAFEKCTPKTSKGNTTFEQIYTKLTFVLYKMYIKMCNWDEAERFLYKTSRHSEDRGDYPTYFICRYNCYLLYSTKFSHDEAINRDYNAVNESVSKYFKTNELKRNFSYLLLDDVDNRIALKKFKESHKYRKLIRKINDMKLEFEKYVRSVCNLMRSDNFNSRSNRTQLEDLTTVYNFSDWKTLLKVYERVYKNSEISDSEQCLFFAISHFKCAKLIIFRIIKKKFDENDDARFEYPKMKCFALFENVDEGDLVRIESLLKTAIYLYDHFLLLEKDTASDFRNSNSMRTEFNCRLRLVRCLIYLLPLIHLKKDSNDEFVMMREKCRDCCKISAQLIEKNESVFNVENFVDVQRHYLKFFELLENETKYNECELKMRRKLLNSTERDIFEIQFIIPPLQKKVLKKKRRKIGDRMDLDLDDDDIRRCESNGKKRKKKEGKKWKKRKKRRTVGDDDLDLLVVSESSSDDENIPFMEKKKKKKQRLRNFYKHNII